MLAIFYSALILTSIILIYFTLKNIDDGILIILVFLTFTLWAIPLDRSKTAALVMICIIIFLKHAIIGFKKQRLTQYHLFLYLFIIVLLFYLPFSGALDYGTTKLIDFIIKNVIPILALLSLAPFRERDYQIIFYTIIVGSCLVALRVLAFGDMGVTRGIETPLPSARTIGMGICLVIVLLLELSRKTRNFRLKLIINLFTLSFLLIALAYTGSRGPVFGVVVFVIGYSVIANREFLKKILTSFRLVTFSIFILIVAYLLPIEFNEIEGFSRLYEKFSSEERIDTARNNIFNLAWDSIIESNGIGIGTGGYSSIDINFDYPHNVFLEIFLETGIIGLSIFVYILIVTTKKMLYLLREYNLTKYEKGLIILWTFGLVNALVSGDISKNILWITLALVWLQPDIKNKFLVKST